jgi:hypothetical protein
VLVTILVRDVLPLDVALIVFRSAMLFLVGRPALLLARHSALHDLNPIENNERAVTGLHSPNRMARPKLGRQ